jgi:hypothetical protein
MQESWALWKYFVLQFGRSATAPQLKTANHKETERSLSGGARHFHFSALFLNWFPTMVSGKKRPYPKSQNSIAAPPAGAPSLPGGSFPQFHKAKKDKWFG